MTKTEISAKIFAHIQKYAEKHTNAYAYINGWVIEWKIGGAVACYLVITPRKKRVELQWPNNVRSLNVALAHFVIYESAIKYGALVEAYMETLPDEEVQATNS